MFDELREREIQVVAAEQQVIADRGAREAIAVVVDFDQREVGRTSADVEHQDALVRRELLPRVVDPRVERRLRLLEQHDRRIAGRGRRLQRELSRGFVEARGHRDEHFLLGEIGVWKREVPGFANVAQHLGLRVDRGQLRSIAIAPRQDRRVAIDAGVTQP